VPHRPRCRGRGRISRDLWGANYERLVAVKERYDPDNTFRLNHNIDPSGDPADGLGRHGPRSS
jgi:hypothetical protein